MKTTTLLSFIKWQDVFSKDDVILIIASSSIVLLILLITVIMLFTYFQRRKLKFILDRQEAERRYLEELANSQLETQEQTLKNIGWELHDNVGQLLSVANMQLNVISTEVPENTKKKFEETRDVINKSLKEVRALSKSLNSDVIQNIGLKKSIRNEIERFNKLKFVNAKLHVHGKHEEKINPKDEIIIFRILQEFMSNSIKHSKAKNLNVVLNYTDDKLNIEISDDGIGFNPNSIKKGSGLINMESRAKLIKSDFIIKSSEKQGVSLSLSYPIKTS